MQRSELPRELSDRGIWWQIVGFTLVGCVSLGILEVFVGSDFWLYRCFATAATRLYWAFVIPLAGLFEEARKMFETKMEIRRAARAKALAKERDKGLREGLREGLRRHSSRLAEARQRFGVLNEETGVVTLPLTLEVENFLLGEANDDD
jgi:hypothetical protein